MSCSMTYQPAPRSAFPTRGLRKHEAIVVKGMPVGSVDAGLVRLSLRGDARCHAAHTQVTHPNFSFCVLSERTQQGEPRLSLLRWWR